MAGLTIAPYLVVLYTLTERLAPPDRAAVAMTILCAAAFALAPATAAAGLLLALLTARHLRRTAEPSTAGVEG